MTVSRLRNIPGIGVDKVGDAADAAADPQFLRLENLDTDLRPPLVAVEATHAAIDRDDANSYLPFQGHLALRDVLLATVEPGQEVVICDPVYAGLVNRIRLAAVCPGTCPAPPAQADGPPTRASSRRPSGRAPPRCC